jgi:hypothetical protein
MGVKAAANLQVRRCTPIPRDKEDAPHPLYHLIFYFGVNSVLVEISSRNTQNNDK